MIRIAVTDETKKVSFCLGRYECDATTILGNADERACAE
jgi:hypothetical protein